MKAVTYDLSQTVFPLFKTFSCLGWTLTELSSTRKQQRQIRSICAACILSGVEGVRREKIVLLVATKWGQRDGPQRSVHCAGSERWNVLTQNILQKIGCVQNIMEEKYCAKKILCTKCEQRDEKGIVRSKWWRRLCLPRAHRALQIQTQTKLQIQTQTKLQIQTQTKTKSESECSKQCFPATSVAKGSLEQLSEI